MTGGFDLSSSKARRKSLAASAFGDESKSEQEISDKYQDAATHLNLTVTDRSPPTFADLVVAGACHSVMYELYRNVSMRFFALVNPNTDLSSLIFQDQKLLLGRMQEVREAYDELEAYVESGEVPHVFKNWAAASDEEKLQMKVGLRSFFVTRFR